MEKVPTSELPAPEPVRAAISRFLAEAGSVEGGRIGGVILYGSTVRGESTDHSDVDLLVLWAGGVEDALDLLIPITTQILIDTGIDLSVHPMTPEDFETIKRMRTGFYENVEREGLVVA